MEKKLTAFQITAMVKHTRIIAIYIFVLSKVAIWLYAEFYKD